VIEKQLARLGDTEFACDGVEVPADPVPFFAVSALNELRRGVVEDLRAARSAARPVANRAAIPSAGLYPERELSCLGNVLNGKAADFYRRHGVTAIEPAAESGLDMRGRKVMTTTYCIKYELGACPRLKQATVFGEPLYLVNDSGRRLRLEFDCVECCMEVIFGG